MSVCCLSVRIVIHKGDAMLSGYILLTILMPWATVSGVMRDKGSPMEAALRRALPVDKAESSLVAALSNCSTVSCASLLAPVRVPAAFTRVLNELPVPNERMLLVSWRPSRLPNNELAV